jgi:hypothetical protein
LRPRPFAAGRWGYIADFDLLPYRPVSFSGTASYNQQTDTAKNHNLKNTNHKYRLPIK